MSNNKCDLLLTNGFIVPVDGQGTVIENGFLAITGDRITAVGQNAEGWLAGRTIELNDRIVMPGMINAHTHAAMTLFRGIADDLPLQEWLENYIFPTEAKYVNEEMVRLGVKLACAEMIRSGATTYCDMYYFEDAASEEVIEAGLRAILGEALLDFPTPLSKNPEEGLAFNLKMIDKYIDNDFIFPAIMPHAPYTCSPEVLAKASEQANEFNIPYVIHLSETKNEVEESIKAHGLTPVGLLNSLNILNENVVAAHCVHLSDEDIKLISSQQARVVHCPESNMKLASGVAPVPRMTEEGIIVALGTDGTASNNNLSLLGEMDSAAKLHKVMMNDPTVMDAISVVEMATINGAKAFNLDKLLGSLEVGKKADIVVVDTNKPHMIPVYNAYSHLVYTAESSDVWMTIVEGKIIYEDGKILTFDEQQVLEEAKNLANEVRKGI